MPECSPGILLDLSKCFTCLSGPQLEAIKTYLLAVQAGGSTEPGALMDAARCFTCLTEQQLKAIQTNLLAAQSGGPTEPGVLLDQAKCFGCLTTQQLEAVKTYLLAVQAGGSVDPGTLFDSAKCFMCLSGNQLAAIQTYLLCQIANTVVVAGFAERAGITDAGQIAALQTLFENAVAHGWWDKCDLIYPFVGGTALAHAQNLKSSSFTITWAGTVTHNANGITGNGTTGYGDTGYVPASSGQWALNSAHLSFYIRTSLGGAASTFVGATSLATTVTRVSRVVATTRAVSLNDTAQDNTTLVALALNMASRLDAANKHFYHGATDASLVEVSTGVATVPFFILAFNNNGVAMNFNLSNLAAVTIGSGITFAEYALMRDDWQTFQTALGRQV